MTPNAWLFLGTCVTAVVGVVGTLVTVRSSRKTATEANEVSKSTAEVANLRSAMEGLAAQLDRVEEWHVECEARCAQCVKDRVRCTEELIEVRNENVQLRLRVEALER